MRVLALSVTLLLSGCAIVGEPPTTVAGTVRTPDGRPIENATVFLWMNHWIPFLVDFQGILQLTRTDTEGRYRFAANADHGLWSLIELRNYYVGALAPGFTPEDAHPRRRDLSQPLDVTLEPRRFPTEDRTTIDCFSACAGIGFRECRSFAEFHFGDKTRCDTWRKDFW